MEESVLNDLERVTAQVRLVGLYLECSTFSKPVNTLTNICFFPFQFTDKTRICFRDALYRLAESSKQSLSSCQDGESMMTSNDDTLM